MRDNSLNSEGAARHAVSIGWRILGRLGLVDTVFNHVSASFGSSSGSSMLLNPNDRLARHVLPDDLVLVPLNSPLDPETADQVNPDGLALHGAVQRLRERPGVVLHLHSRAAVAVACVQGGLLPLTQTAMEFAVDMCYFDYRGLFGVVEVESIASQLAHGGVALLRNHGLLVVTNSVEEAIYVAYYVEESCRLQLMITGSGDSAVLPDPSVVSEASRELQVVRPAVAQLFFAGMTRWLQEVEGVSDESGHNRWRG
jgi:ribulose-5-phosphate 4-epimerase/fuculose-1-phosphate aldolase